MRIIGGSFKSRRFDPPKKFEGRPTTDFAKEGLFNVLHNEIDLEECKVLDLFAGTGSISYELISRGAKEVVCVDNQVTALRFIRKMADEWGMDNLWVEKNDAISFAQGVREPFDLIIADPPFESDCFDALHEATFRPECLISDGLLLIEHGPRTDISHLKGYDRTKRYGHVNFSFFYPNY